MTSIDSFHALRRLESGGRSYEFYSLAHAARAGLAGTERLPHCLKVLLENLLRHEDGAVVTRGDIEAFADWARDGRAERDLAFHPARIMMPDSSGVPLLADLAAMRDAVHDLGGDVARVNPRVPVDLVIDHSVVVDRSESPDALAHNVALEYARNAERYAFLRWAQGAFANVRIVPPGVGICHQVNLEFLASVVTSQMRGNRELLVPDTLLGMDSHTPMINALGVLGWGVGGIEAAAATLGQPVSLRMPQVVGVRVAGRLREGVTATDLVLTITQRLHAHLTYATALSMLVDNRLKAYGQQALRFHSKCAYYDDYGALAHQGEEGERMAAALGEHCSVLFLAQHGVIAGGPTVGQAFHDLYYLERACMNQVMAQWTQQPLREVPAEMARKGEQQYDSQRSEAELHFASLKRVLAGEDSAFAEPARSSAAA